MEDKEKELGKAPNSLIFVSLASMYLDNGMVDEAIDLCKSGLEIEPENEEAHLILARAEIEKGNLTEAGERLQEILRKNPDNGTARELLDQIEPQSPPAETEKEVVKPIPVEEQKEPAVEAPADISDIIDKPVEELVMDGEEFVDSYAQDPSVDDVIEEAIQAASQVTGLIPIEEEDDSVGIMERVEEVVAEGEREEPAEPSPPVSEELQKVLNEKMETILQMEGVISCFFRLREGTIVKPSQLVGNVDDLIPLLDALLGAVKAAAEKLETGSLELLMIEIEKGVFYIYSQKDFDCFLVSQDINNFGFVKVMIPRILDDLSIGP
jgi:tetratricopeptide (TPR) repeat protein